MLALRGCEFTTVVAVGVGVEFEHGLLLDHHPGDPRIGNGEEEEQPDHSTGAEA